MRRNVLKSEGKINRKKLVHAKKADAAEGKFEGLTNPIECSFTILSFCSAERRLRLGWGSSLFIHCSFDGIIDGGSPSHIK